jgi:hypothetical protein
MPFLLITFYVYDSCYHLHLYLTTYNTQTAAPAIASQEQRQRQTNTIQITMPALTLPSISTSLSTLPYNNINVANNDNGKVRVVTVTMNQPFTDAYLQQQDHSIVYCACARNAEKWLPTTLANLTQLAKEISSTYHIIFCESGDDTLRVLQQYRDALPLSSQERISIIHDSNNNNPTRTVRLAKCRNSLVSMVHDTFYDYDFFAMIDMDDLYPNYALEHSRELRELLALSKPQPHEAHINPVWDALSFARDPLYYDAWAVRTDQHPYSVWGRKGDGNSRAIQKYYSDKLRTLIHNPTMHQFLQVHSAFCGFAFYRISSTIDCQYNGWNETYDEEECEHVPFHYDMINKHQAKILISPLQMGWGY